MAEHLRLHRPLHRSIFVRLVGVMVGLAVSLLLLVTVFFFLFIGRSLAHERARLLSEITALVAARAPDRVEAGALAAQLEMPIRYDGPGSSWATSEASPQAEVIVRASPRGGTYTFSWELGRPLAEAHAKLVWVLLGLIVIVVVIAHEVLRRTLHPLHALRDGVARLGKGELDVVVERRSEDELGALTGAFNDMAGRVRDMIRARDELLRDVSHELRSPLTRMKVALALLPQGDLATRLAGDVVEMEKMIHALLELERVRDGKLERAPFDLGPVVQEVVGAFPGVQLTLQDGLRLEGDEGRVRAAVRNLVENAVKYSLPDSRPVEVSAAREGDVVVVRVVDDGPGIPEADLPRLFEPFFRVDRSRARTTGGYGLGLSLARRIARAHGGEVTAANTAGARGATFRVNFPAA